MTTLTQNLLAAYSDMQNADAEDLMQTAKAIYHGFLNKDPNECDLLFEARDAAMNAIVKEAKERIDLYDEDDEELKLRNLLLTDVIAIADEHFTPQ